MNTTMPVSASPIASDDDNDITLISNEMSIFSPSGSGSNAGSGNGGGRSESPLRKRARYESSDQDDGMDRTADKDREKVLTRDESYYLADGSCVLLVEDTLFNVHRTILSKDTSFFSGMFTIPQGHTLEEGISDAHPIHLTGDTPSEFRNFLWALYALPHELMVVHTARADLNQLIDIARISNKYSFKSLETWSLDAITDFVQRKPSPILTTISTSSYTFSPESPSVSIGTKSKEAHESTARLTQLIRLAQLCGHDRLLTTLISLLRQLMSLNIQYAYLAMTLADELELRPLRGAAYLEVMSKVMIVPRVKQLSAVSVGAAKTDTSATTGAGVDQEEQALGDEDDEEEIPSLTSSQRLRLLSGYYRLTHSWDHLRTHPPHFDHAPSCGATWHQHGCTQSFTEFWKEKTKGDAVVGMGMADVLGRLKAVQKEFDRWGSATYMHHDCRMSARRGLAESVRRLEDSLPDYFE